MVTENKTTMQEFVDNKLSSSFKDDDQNSFISTSSFTENSILESDLDTSVLKKFCISPNAKHSELIEAIESCKIHIENTDECSNDRKWLQYQLVELRLRIEELKDGDNTVSKLDYTIMGHHFKLKKLKSRSHHCDHCCGLIWNMVHGLYVCNDCNYTCHKKCVEKINRVCVHIITSVNGELIMSICPEKGLAAQGYKCAECKISFVNVIEDIPIEPRLCDYSGLYFCSNCHWNKLCEIPARVVHNWDWEKRRVSQVAYQLLTLSKNIPLINVGVTNEKLFNFVTELGYICKLRNDLKKMIKYLAECKNGKVLIDKELVNVTQNIKLYSMTDMEQIKNGLMGSKLNKLVEKCRHHITMCEICSGKGYICEICNNNDVIFPFDGAVVNCKMCNTYFHHGCWTKKSICSKCDRIRMRALSKSFSDDDEYEEYDFSSGDSLS